MDCKDSIAYNQIIKSNLIMSERCHTLDNDSNVAYKIENYVVATLSYLTIFEFRQ